MNDETKSVSQVLLRDRIMEQVKHADLYKTFREILTKKFTDFFNADWIAFSFNGQKGYWHSNTQIAVPVQSSYSSKSSKHFDIDCIFLNQDEVKSLFGLQSECPSEIMNGIKKSITCQGVHCVRFKGNTLELSRNVQSENTQNLG